MGSVSTLSQMLHLLLSPYDFRSIQTQAQTNFIKSRALTPPPPIPHDRHLFERSLPSTNSTLLPHRLSSAQWEKLDTVHFKDLVQSGKFTVKVTGLKARASESPFSNSRDLQLKDMVSHWHASISGSRVSHSCDLQVKANASQNDIWDAINNAGALEIYSTFDPDVRPSYPGFLSPSHLYEERDLHITVTDGSSVYDASSPGGLQVNK